MWQCIINELDSLSCFCVFGESMKRVEVFDEVDKVIRFLCFYKKFFFSEIVG